MLVPVWIIAGYQFFSVSDQFSDGICLCQLTEKLVGFVIKPDRFFRFLIGGFLLNFLKTVGHSRK